MAKVSVIMPVYNGAQFVCQAIDSVLGQTLQDWELVVVDDGSTDETPRLLSGYTDPRIQVVRQPNGGEARARNTALDRITGQYVALLDSDDLMVKNYLLDLSTFLDTHPEHQAVYSDGYVIDKNGKRLFRLAEHRPCRCTGNILEALVLSPGLLTSINSILFNRSTVEENQIRFDPTYVIGVDWDFWIRLASVASFGYLDRVTCAYRVHQTNLSRTVGSDRRKQDLARLRLSLMTEGWFDQLSADTRANFIYTLLIAYLEGDQEQQRAVLRGPQVTSLPGRQRAWLWRRVGVQLLKTGSDLPIARQYFQEAAAADPDDTRARALLRLSTIQFPLIRPFLKVLQAAAWLYRRVASPGKPASRPIPHRIR